MPTLSTNFEYQNGAIPNGFVPRAVTKENIRIILQHDHCCSILKDGIRNNKHFISCDFLWLDSDNGFSIEDFKQIEDFKDVEYILYTSRNHQKEKDGKPACDRFHVLFPVRTITSKDELEEKINIMVSKFSWSDKGAKGVSRLLYGNRSTEVHWHDGKEYCPELPRNELLIVPKRNIQKTEHSGNDEKKEMIFEALQLSAARGIFDEYGEWIKLGGSLRAEGYTLQDWLSLSFAGQNQEEAYKKWESFSSMDRLSGGSLMYYARLAQPELLQKGSMLPTPRIRISDGTESKFEGYSTDAPTSLEIIPSEEKIKNIYEQITYLENQDKRKLKSDWYLEVLRHDAELSNCLKYDYTTGGKNINYPNTTILKTAIRKRLKHYGVPENKISDQAVDRLIDDVEHKNRFYNRVLAFTKMLRIKHGDGIDGVELLDKFITMLGFQDIEGYGEAQVIKYYREVFHIFLLRLHLHINGTAITENGEYYGLMTNDIVPVLGGAQNIGKTTLCQWLACNREDMYVDLGSGGKGGNFGTSDTIRQVRGRMIAELGEMKIMKDSSNVESVKSFISKTKYELDIKFVEHSEPMPSTVSYIGTSNPEEYLSDVTGNRRFFPIKLESIDKVALSKNKILIEKIHAYYSYLAETVHLDDRFNAVAPSNELNEFMEHSRNNAMIRYADHGCIMEVVQEDFRKEKEKNHRDGAIHKLEDHHIHKLVANAGYQIMVGNNSIIASMSELGYTKKPVKIDGKTVRTWAKTLR